MYLVDDICHELLKRLQFDNYICKFILHLNSKWYTESTP